VVAKKGENKEGKKVVTRFQQDGRKEQKSKGGDVFRNARRPRGGGKNFWERKEKGERTQGWAT